MEAFIVLVMVLWLLTALGRLLASLAQGQPPAAPGPTATAPPQPPAPPDPIWDRTPEYPVSTQVEVLPQGTLYRYPEGRYRVVVTVTKAHETPAGRMLRRGQDGTRRIDLGMFNTWSEALRAYEQKRAAPAATKPLAADRDIAGQEAPAPQPARCLAQGKVHALGTARRTLNGKTFDQAYLDVRLKSGKVQRIWGEDLPRALDASNARQGDRVRVIFQGMQDVPVEENGNIQIKQKRLFEVRQIA